MERGGRRVLDRIDLAVGPGEALALTGPNGVGKSTLLRAIAGLCAVRAGTIQLVGWSGAPAAAMHLVGHLDAVKPQLGVHDNLAFWGRWLDLSGRACRPEAVEAALCALGLAALGETPAAFLSQGQRRRLALARLALVPRPMWLLDEPTAGLDAASRRRFAALMAAHLAAGGSILAATHEALEVPARELALDPA